MPGWPGFSSQPARLILTAPRKAVATIEVMTGGLMKSWTVALAGPELVVPSVPITPLTSLPGEVIPVDASPTLSELLPPGV